MTVLVSASQVAQYREQGYVRLCGIFSGGALDALQMTTEALCAHRDASTVAWTGGWKQGHDGGDRFQMVTLSRIHRLDPIWGEAVKSPALVDAVSTLAGRAMRCVDSMLIVKPPEHGQAFPPHQDAAYYADNQPHYMVVGLYLDDANHDNGAVAYLPGSHLSGFREHTRDGKKLLPDIRLEQLIEVPAQAGDVVCASIFTVHGSYPNRSSSQRRLVRLGFQPV